MEKPGYEYCDLERLSGHKEAIAGMRAAREATWAEDAEFRSWVEKLKWSEGRDLGLTATFQLRRGLRMSQRKVFGSYGREMKAREAFEASKRRWLELEGVLKAWNQAEWARKQAEEAAAEDEKDVECEELLPLPWPQVVVIEAKA